MLHIQPTHYDDTYYRRKVKPIGSTSSHFKKIQNNIKKLKRKIRNKQASRFSKFSISSVTVRNHNNLPIEPEISLLTNKWFHVYSHYLNNDTTLEKAKTNYNYQNTVDSIKINDQFTKENGAFKTTVNGRKLAFSPTKKTWEKAGSKDKQSKNIDFSKYTKFAIETIPHDNKKTEWKIAAGYEFPKPRKYRKESKVLTKNYSDIINKISNKTHNTTQIINTLANGYYANYELIPLIQLLHNIKNTILLKYGYNHPEIIDAIIEQYNLNYIHIPQTGFILISHKKIPIKQNKFTEKFPKKQTLTPKEKKKILTQAEIPENRIKSYLNSKTLGKHRLKEIELLSEMKHTSRLTNKEIKFYKFKNTHSDLTKKDLNNIIREGGKTRQNLKQRGYNKIIKNIENNKFFKKYYGNIITR